MTSNNVPTISVTHDHSNSRPTTPSSSSSSSSSSENDDSYANDLDCNRNLSGGVTDVEDFDSHNDLSATPKSQHSPRLTPSNTLAAPKSRTCDNDVTDIEDYNDDTDSEEEKSKVYPELKLSLQEFLQQGLQEQALVDNEGQQKIEMRAGNFLQAQNLNGVPDYLTDCEDYNTDSELEYDEKSVCMDLIEHAVGGPEQVCIADTARPLKDADDAPDSDEYEDVSVISDISDLACALAEFTAAHARGLSEDELMEMSGDEEVCQIACSGSSSDAEDDNKSDSMSERSLAPVDVTFVSANGQERKNSTVSASCSQASKKCFLSVAPARNDEVLTDVERLDDSAAEDEDSFDNEEDDQKPIPRAIILAPGDDGICQTDTEEVTCDDAAALVAAAMAEAQPVAVEALPPPHREVIELKEDRYGDTITNVMPMDDEYQFGIPSVRDDANTDSEDYSCAEEYEFSGSVADDEGVGASHGHLIEGEITVANEMLKMQQSKRLELHSNAESVTDVEEIYVAGTNRRKKVNKTRQPGKQAAKAPQNKFLLDVGRQQEDGGTDVEDIDLSDCGLSPQHKRLSELRQQGTAVRASADKVTDVEELTADEVSDYSEHDAVPPSVSGDSLRAYTANSANIVITLETDAKHKSGKVRAGKHTTAAMQQQQMQQQLRDELEKQPVTDVEDVQLPSDAEELVEQYSALPPDTNCTNCSELNDMLNESYTVVHEKSVRNFDADAEKLHIKGSTDGRDAYTDVEYVESDEPAARGGN